MHVLVLLYLHGEEMKSLIFIAWHVWNQTSRHHIVCHKSLANIESLFYSSWRDETERGCMAFSHGIIKNNWRKLFGLSGQGEILTIHKRKSLGWELGRLVIIDFGGMNRGTCIGNGSGSWFSRKCLLRNILGYMNCRLFMNF